MSPTDLQVKAEVVEHLDAGPRTRLLILRSPTIAETARPGQFVHVLCSPSYDPLLRRPLCIHGADSKKGNIMLLYDVLGRGTALLAQRCKGDVIDLLGPLGTAFTMPESPEEPVILVAGGIGVAPLCFLASSLNRGPKYDNVTFLIGARTKDFLLCASRLDRQGADVRIATDDGTAGHHGFVTDLLEQCISESGSVTPLIYACGPVPMLKAVSRIVSTHGLRCEISTEAKMACGVGACVSCVIKVRSGDGTRYVRCCKEGPVFNAEDIVWD